MTVTMTRPVGNLEPMTEYAITCMAKQGDKKAVEWLWGKYKKSLCGIIGKYWGYHHLPQDEIEEEAIDVLFHKLEIFKPEKVKKTGDVWSFSYMLTSGASHCRNRLKTQGKIDNKIDLYDDTQTGDDTPFSKTVYRALNFDPSRFDQNNPETAILKTIDGTPGEKASLFLKLLSPLQKTILKLRRRGLTVAQVADRMGRSPYVIRKALTETKQAASSVFGIAYGKAHV